MNNISFKLLSRANTALGFVLYFFVKFLVLCHLFSILLKLCFRRFIIGSIDIDITDDILDSLSIICFLTSLADEVLWRLEQFLIGLLAFFRFLGLKVL